MLVDVLTSGKLKKIVMHFEMVPENMQVSLQDPLGREHFFFPILDASKPPIPSKFIFIEGGKYYFFYHPRNPGIHKLRVFYKMENKKHSFEQEIKVEQNL